MHFTGEFNPLTLHLWAIGEKKIIFISLKELSFSVESGICSLCFCSTLLNQLGSFTLFSNIFSHGKSSCFCWTWQREAQLCESSFLVLLVWLQVQAHGSDAMVDEENCVFFLPHRPRSDICEPPIFLFMKGTGKLSFLVFNISTLLILEHPHSQLEVFPHTQVGVVPELITMNHW